MDRATPETEQAWRAAANRLHHLSMRYVGALAELGRGRPVLFLPQGEPGLKEARDFIDCINFVRAEVNALTRLLLEAKLVSAEQVGRAFVEEYDHLCKAKAEFLGVGVNDAGLVFKGPGG